MSVVSVVLVAPTVGPCTRTWLSLNPLLRAQRCDRIHSEGADRWDQGARCDHQHRHAATSEPGPLHTFVTDIPGALVTSAGVFVPTYLSSLPFTNRYCSSCCDIFRRLFRPFTNSSHPGSREKTPRRYIPTALLTSSLYSGVFSLAGAVGVPPVSGTVELGRFAAGVSAGPAPGVYAMIGGGGATECISAAGGIDAGTDEYDALGASA